MKWPSGIIRAQVLSVMISYWIVLGKITIKKDNSGCYVENWLQKGIRGSRAGQESVSHPGQRCDLE